MNEAVNDAYVSMQPIRKDILHSILGRLGHDLRDWNNIKGGAARASTNPKYCYNWSFENPGKAVAICLWYPEIMHDANSVFQANNLRGKPAGSSNVSKNIWQRRARAVDRDIQSAYLNRLPLDVILLSGSRRDKNDPNAQASRVNRRQLDTMQWAVTEYDFESGDFLLVRGAKPVAPDERTQYPEVTSFREGAMRRAFRNHRLRERKLRLQKLKEVREKNGGRLVCEVPNCSFDFAARYGLIGDGYAQVHHLEPLSEAPMSGRAMTLDKLAVVCANCHAMIHVGGECRPLDGLIVR